MFSLDADGAFLDELRARTRLSSLVAKDVKLSPAGRETKGCCPFHSEKMPSFIVNDEKGFYHCFGCGAHGDAIRWMTDKRGLSFMDAVTALAKVACIQVPALDIRTLEQIADLICGDNGPLYRSGPDITRFFAAAGAPQYSHDGSTRKSWVLESLKNASPSERRSAILRLVSPREYGGNSSQVQQVLDRLNPLLKLEGIRIIFEGPNPSLAYFEPTFELPTRNETLKAAPAKAARVFISYSHADGELKDRLLTHLAALKREGLISVWHDRALLPGECLSESIQLELSGSDLILLLISADFIASDYCVEKEMQRAFARQLAGDTKVVAIILRDCQWMHVPTAGDRTLKDFLALPRDGRPIVQWPQLDEPLSQAAGEIRRLIQEPLP